MKPFDVKSDIAWATPTQIFVHGFDLCEDLVGKVDFGQMSFLQIFGRLPNDAEARMFNAVLVILVEHGITPSSLATRLTHCGAPESVQGAVAAGLLTLGSVYAGSLDNAAKILQDAIPDPKAPGDLDALAVDIVTDYRSRKQLLPGIGHPFHKPIDPRTPALFKVAKETGFDGPFVALISKISDEATRQSGRQLPVNVTGAMGAVASEFGLPWGACRGLAVAARAVGLVGHILEEMRQPIGEAIYFQLEHEVAEYNKNKQSET